MPPPSIFAGENFDLLAANMRTCLKAQSLWDVVENGSNLAPLPNNPIVAQIRSHNEEVAQEGKALAIQAAIHKEVFFIKIPNLET